MSPRKKSARREETRPRPRLGSGLLCDTMQPVAGQGKPNCTGVFTTLNAWAFPCTRTWQVVFTAFNMSPAKAILSLYVKKVDTSTRTRIGGAQLLAGQIKSDMVIGLQTAHTFTEPGAYNLIARLHRSRAELRIPFRVELRDWPTFSNEEVAFASKGRAGLITSVRAAIDCSKCKTAYVFEESILPGHTPAPGVQKFPKLGNPKCKNGHCGHTLHLKDVQGQMRQTLKDMIRNRMAQGSAMFPPYHNCGNCLTL